MARSALVFANSAMRLAFGIVALVAPETPFIRGERRRGTSTNTENLAIRAFGAHQIGVAALGLASLPAPGVRTPAMALAAATDVADIVAAIAEGRVRRTFGPDLVGGIAMSSGAAVLAVIALRDG